jgi:hypothetical protein
MEVKLALDVFFYDDLRLMVWRPRGIVDENAINKILEFMGKKETAADKPFNRFTDTLLVDSVDLNFRYVFHISLFRRLSYVGWPVKSAILVTRKDLGHYSRLHQILTQGSLIRVRIFQDRKEAAKWLGVPIERLTAETTGGELP